MSMRRSSDKRDQVIVRTSIIGIVANIFLAGFKFMVGILTHSIAITLDAVNNLSDVLSSVITIIGTKLAGKSPDKKHPYGHGRYEYLAAIIIAVIVLYAGISALIEAIKSILHPAQVNYTPVSLVIVVVAVVIKLLLGNYVGRVGKKVGSDALIVSGADAKFDAIISTTTLLAAIIFLLTGFRLEAYLAAVIAILLIKSSFEMLNDTISLILGQRANAETSRKVKEVIQSVHGVGAVYDLIFNDYGPNLILATAHIEVPDTFSADQIDTMTREINEKVYHSCKIVMAAVGIYSVNTKDDKAAEIRKQIRDIVMGHEHVLQMHGFYIDFEKMKIQFDMIVGFEAKDRHAIYDHVSQEIKEKYPEFDVEIVMDTDYND